MQQVLNAQIVHGESEAQINEKISELVAKGYVPLGCATIATDSEFVDIVQTMVLYNPDTNEEA